MFLVDHALAYRLELAHAWRGIRYAQAQHVLHHDIRACAEPVAGGYAIFAGDDSPLNRAVGLGLARPITAADLDTFQQFYLSRNSPPRLDVCPLADPSLIDELSCRNHHLEEFHSVLVCPLPASAELGAPPTQIQISQAGPADAELWIRTVAQGFDAASVPDRRTLGIAAPNFHSADATCFIARIDGEPAGGGAMYIHEGVAEFGGASTRLEFRGRGVQTALLWARLVAARAKGCDLALVLTTPGTASERNAERAGFRPVYTGVSVLMGH